MGNALSGDLSKNNDKLMEKIDKIAADLIIKEDFNEMKKLFNKRYCQKLQILTSSILSKNFSDVELKKLQKRVKLNHSSIDFSDNQKKKELCNNIAKFYVKIGHLYAAILATINPVYTYTDSDGIQKSSGLLEKIINEKKKLQHSQKNVDIQDNEKINNSDYVQDIKNIDNYSEDPEGLLLPKQMNLCSKRIQTLLRDYVDNSNPNERIKLKPLVCNKEYADSSVLDETGIPELFNLYKDVYNPNTGKFYDMSPSAKKEYQKDVQMYYTMVTGNKNIPSDLGELNFSKIKLKDYTLTPKCVGEDAPYNKEYNGTVKERLFKEYIDHIKTMIKNTNASKGSLLKILDQVFTETKNKDNNESVVSISPTLTMRKLEKLVAQTRRIIVKLYLNCEKDFEKGLQIFEAIVEKVKFDTSLRRLESLDQDISGLTGDPSDDYVSSEKEQDEIEAHKSCLLYPGWRKFQGATRKKSIWLDPIDPVNRVYDQLKTTSKDKNIRQNTAMYRDMMLCNQDEASKKLCEKTRENWPELFVDNQWKMNKCATDITRIKSGYDLGTRASREIPNDEVYINSGVRFNVNSDAEIPDENDGSDGSVDGDSSLVENTREQIAPTPRTRRRRSRRIQFTNEDGVNEEKWVSPDEDEASEKITSWWRSQMSNNRNTQKRNPHEQPSDTQL